MINIQTRRAGLFVIASVVNDNLDITATLGFTEEGARRRLLRILDKKGTDR